ncbi:retrotransposon protein, putative, ty1-copia subclass [Tanacetum coccineum]
MARKPFPYQVERAKDLLGLIQTDVCGPFGTVSREGASYFITFIDGFSRYGYVYLMKHKHEVFETFKVFQNEVENQLGKKIKAIRSDQGGYPKETMGYYYYRLKNKTRVARNVELFENSLMVQEANGSHGLLESRDLNEPPNYKATLSDPEFDEWLKAMNTEMQSMKDNQVWVLVNLPPNGRTVGSKWLFKKKTDMNSNVHTFKSYLVARGYTQTCGGDYGDTFNPVADIRAIRILLAIVAFYDYEIWQMDVKTAFLNGYISEDVYMVQPEGFLDPKHPNKSMQTSKFHLWIKASI